MWITGKKSSIFWLEDDSFDNHSVRESEVLSYSTLFQWAKKTSFRTPSKKKSGEGSLPWLGHPRDEISCLNSSSGLTSEMVQDLVSKFPRSCWSTAFCGGAAGPACQCPGTFLLYDYLHFKFLIPGYLGLILYTSITMWSPHTHSKNLFILSLNEGKYSDWEIFCLICFS